MKAYKFFAYLIAAEVVVQAAAIAFALFGLGYWIEEDGGMINKAVFDSDKGPEFTGVVGFMVHGMNGMMIIPAIALILLITSFFAKVPGGTKQAAIVFGLVVLQVMLGLMGHGIVWLGPLHAINAFFVLWSALVAARLAGGTLFSRTAAPATV